MELSNEDTLKTLNLTTLETRRVTGDLIEVFKIFKGFDNVNVHSRIFIKKHLPPILGWGQVAPRPL